MTAASAEITPKKKNAQGRGIKRGLQEGKEVSYDTLRGRRSEVRSAVLRWRSGRQTKDHLLGRGLTNGGSQKG